MFGLTCGTLGDASSSAQSRVQIPHRVRACQDRSWSATLTGALLEGEARLCRSSSAIQYFGDGTTEDGCCDRAIISACVWKCYSYSSSSIAHYSFGLSLSWTHCDDTWFCIVVFWIIACANSKFSSFTANSASGRPGSDEGGEEKG